MTSAIEAHSLIGMTVAEDRSGTVSADGSCACGFWEAQTLNRERLREQFEWHRLDAEQLGLGETL